MKEQIASALRDVLDPHFQISLADMGMIREITVTGGRVRVELAYPCLACPAWDDIQADVRKRLARIPEVTAAEVCVSTHSSWKKTDMTEAGRAFVREFGIQV